MGEKSLPQKINIIESLKEAKEYILFFAMVVAATIYLWHNLDIKPKDLKWGFIFVPFGAFFVFNLWPKILKNRELNLRPTGNPDQRYFTTSPRADDAYHFFISGYEPYLEWLRHPQASVLYLTGSSGSGKSSLINAYLAPQLEKENSQKTNVYVLRSYHNPLKVIYEALNMDDNTDSKITGQTVFEEIIKASKMLSAKEQILIVLDQFEEFFLLRNTTEALQDNEEIETIDELKSFFKRFNADPPKHIHILLSYRDDFQQLVDQLKLPARIEHVNFEQVNLLTFEQASNFMKNCPGLEIPENQLNRILKEAASIDTPIAVRPIVLNLLGIILQRMVSQRTIPKREGNLIRKYILDSLGKELKQDRATVLKAMLTDFNTAMPRTINEMSKSSRLNVSQLDNQMIVMQHDGLVRCLDAIETSQGKRKWQIAHDFIALQLEKVVYGIRKTLWQKAKPWIAPVLASILIIFTSSYYGNRINAEKKKAVARIEKAGLVWIETSKTISGGNINLNDSIFQSLSPDFATLQPDTLEIVIQSNIKAQSIANLNILGKVTSLKKIKINNNSKLKNLNGLKDLPALVTLDLSNCSNLQNINALNELTTLTHLDLSDCDSLQNIDSLKGLTHLKYLDLKSQSSIFRSSDYVVIRNVDALKGLTALKVLNLRGRFGLQNVNALKKLTNLTYLDLSISDDLQDIDGLKELINLTYLDLGDCRNLQNVDALKGLTALKELSLYGCSGLQNVDALKKLTNLETLNLTLMNITDSQYNELRNALPEKTKIVPPRTFFQWPSKSSKD